MGGPLRQGDVEAEFAELSGEASGEAGSLGALKVIGPKIVIRRPALQHVEDRRQHGRRHGHNRLAGAPTRFEPLEQSMQVAGLDPHRTPGTLHEDSLEPWSACPEASGAPLARTLVVAGAEPSQEIRWPAVGKRGVGGHPGGPDSGGWHLRHELQKHA